MTRTEKVHKECDRCGHKVFTARRKRVCSQQERNSHGFLTGWRCPGKLRTVVPRKRKRKAAAPKVPPHLGIGHVLTAEYQAQLVAHRGAQARQRAARALAKAKAKQQLWLREARRIETLCRKWTRQVRRLEARVALTDAQFEEERQRAAKAAQVGQVKRRLSRAIAKQEEQQP